MRSGRRRGMSPAGGRLEALNTWLVVVVAFVMLPALAIFMLVNGSMSIGKAWSAARGGGQLGTLHVTSRECGYHRYGGYRCTGLYGTFASADGTTHLQHAFLDGIPDGAGVGNDVAVRFLGERNPAIVYRSSGSREWLLIAGLMAGSALVLATWLFVLVRWLRGRFRLGARPSPPDESLSGTDPEGHVHVV